MEKKRKEVFKMIAEAKLRSIALKELLGSSDDRIPRLVEAKPRCEEEIWNPCGLCAVQGQVARTHLLRTALDIASICCPEGKMPDYLKRQLAVVLR